MPILNLGFLAHVDAGKTSLTERILYETGVTDALGRVDRGDTQTDTLDLERQRGITIQAAVVSFPIGDLKVNLIDTPGHADFIAEVERALSALDGVVILVSAVEGVQPQTRKLVRAVRALGLPMLIFVNKIDRAGACANDLPGMIHRKLGLRLVELTRPLAPGSRDAGVLPPAWDDPAFAQAVIDCLSDGDGSDEFVRAWLRADGRLSRRAIRRELRRQVRDGAVAPVYYGSAITGVGIDHLLRGIREWLPRASEDGEAPLAGTVFTIRRDASGEKLVFLRLRGGALRLRQAVPVQPGDANATHEAHEARVTGIDRFDTGRIAPTAAAAAGEIVRLHGLREARIGDVVGTGGNGANHRLTAFAPPALESVVRPLHAHQVTAAYAALQQIAEQDPLIEVRRDARHAEISVRLFGEVQKEVIAATLANQYGIEAEFAGSRAICVERPVGSSLASEMMGEPGNPFAAGVALRLEPAPPGSGIAFARPSGALPLAFYKAIEETVYATLAEGLRGWEVIDCAVTVTQTMYSSVGTVAGDFRKLTPLVLMTALREAGTRVHEPVQRFTLQAPAAAVGEILLALVAVRGLPEDTTTTTQAGEEEATITGTIPAATVRAFEQRLPALSGGEGVFASTFAGYAPVNGPPPVRPRTDANPLNRKQYLARISQGIV